MQHILCTYIIGLCYNVLAGDRAFRNVAYIHIKIKPYIFKDILYNHK